MNITRPLQIVRTSIKEVPAIIFEKGISNKEILLRLKIGKDLWEATK